VYAHYSFVVPPVRFVMVSQGAFLKVFFAMGPSPWGLAHFMALPKIPMCALKPLKL